MGDHSAISWTDATWSPTLGCQKVSAGCTNCYAINVAAHNERMAQGLAKPSAHAGLTRRLPDGSYNWTGEVRLLPERLPQPLHWRKPRRIFVDSMSDLFHADVPEAFIDQAFAVMALSPRHTYQLLTKRPERLHAYLNDPIREHAIGRAALALANDHGLDWDVEWRKYGSTYGRSRWPLPNVWLGVSVEDQAAADARIPYLIDTPAACRFLSCEPLLGPVNIQPYLWDQRDDHAGNDYPFGLDWVITGGESGPTRRPFDPAWAASLRDQCHAFHVAFFHKQNGGLTHASGGDLLDGVQWHEYPALAAVGAA